MNIWRSIQNEPAPKDGKPFWGFLKHSGVRLLRWSTAEEYAFEHGGKPEDYESLFVELSDPTKEWWPDFWAPVDAINLPAGVDLQSLTR